MERSTVAELKSLPADCRNPFAGVFILKRIDPRKTRADKDFLSLEFGDKTGSFQTICWSDSPWFDNLRDTSPGGIYQVEGQAGHYNDAFSPKLIALHPVDEETAARQGWLEQLVESALEDPESLWREIEDGIHSLAPDPLRKTVALVFDEFKEPFRSSPAAVSMHHAYRSGLLEHTVHMLRCCHALLPHYPEIDAGLATAGILVHDIGKIHEYTRGLATSRSATGILQGHVVLGYRIVRKAAMQSKLSPELTERLEHIVLSHQGELEWGAAAKAATPEAVFVSMIDNLDAKMGMVQDALRKTPEGRDFSDFIPGLGAPLLVRPPHPDDR